MFKNMSKWEVIVFLVVSGSHVRVLIPINNCHFNANFAWTSKMFILVKIFFGCSCEMAFVMTLTVQFNIWTLSNF